MASFWFHLALIMAFMASPLLSLSSQINSKAYAIAATPSFLTNPPPLSPFQELSPDILPLLPSPGGAVPPTGFSMPTIPSSPSPPNPDELVAPGPDSAFSPLGSLPASAAAPKVLVSYLNTAVFVGLAAYWSISLLRI
ncbi:classical arabinogalactan protein 25 [Alnus glutinosa]|uniref:classical arabinogalactan protein 25 n=1 Tax=Alnus glutinosa TaxID=3517 RepID=UPI002D77599E|nr:classical arabinogalactan protein 25 [Alnus glutinosa]